SAQMCKNDFKLTPQAKQRIEKADAIIVIAIVIASIGTGKPKTTTKNQTLKSNTTQTCNKDIAPLMMPIIAYGLMWISVEPKNGLCPNAEINGERNNANGNSHGIDSSGSVRRQSVWDKNWFLLMVIQPFFLRTPR
ncbi:MAG: hypothetical protein ABIK12_16850, partial [Pseudomonadota bacterium]